MSEAKYLVLIAVGPVQEFIASGRMLRDLWCGSFLLSELSKAVAQSLRDQACKLIFPAVDEDEAHGAAFEPGQSVANKLLAATGEDPQKVISKARDDFFQYWNRLSRKARDKLPPSCLKNDLFEKQLSDFGDFYGCWVRLDDDYAGCRRRLEQILSGRKCLREFAAPGWNGAGHPKSSLDGIRESVISDGNRGALEKRFLLKTGEHLDSMGIVKRMVPHMQEGHSRPHFDNLAQVAVRSYADGLAKDEKARHVLQGLYDLDRSLFKDFPECRHGYDFLPEGFPVELFLPSELLAWLDSGGPQATGKLASIKGIMKKLKRHTKKEPGPYSCLLVGDGDHMGKTLDCLTDVDTHRRFSRELQRFAGEMDAVVSEFSGRLIYSGGDDFMAYAPLHSVLACAAKIRCCFDRAMNRALSDSGIALPTFSMGMAIVHHRLPLHRALETARRAEQAAKEDGGRASLAIIQAKRSGSPVMVCGKWEGTGEGLGFIDRLEVITNLYLDGCLSSRLGYQLRRVSGECGSRLVWSQDASGTILPENSASAETMRLVGRKRRQDGRVLGAADQMALFKNQTDLRTMADELVIARQLASARELADAVWLRQTARTAV